MDRRDFLKQVRQLRCEGKSIRNIATELSVHRSRVHRALYVMKSAAIGEITGHSGPVSRGRLWLLEFPDQESDARLLPQESLCSSAGGH